MEKQKKWQKYLIVAVILLTFYNILPTLFYYTKPLKAPVDAARATKISQEIVARVNALEPQAEEWLVSFCKLLNIKPLSITLQHERPQFLALTFKDEKDANLFRRLLPRAGTLIPFTPAQLSLYDPQDTVQKTVVVQRRIPLHLDPTQLTQYTQFAEKFDAAHRPTPLYRSLSEDRALEIGIALAGTSENASLMQALSSRAGQENDNIELLSQMAQNILSYAQHFGEDSPVAHRYFASFTQILTSDRTQLVQNFLNTLENAQRKLRAEKATLQEESDRLRTQGEFLDTIKQQRLEWIVPKEKTLDTAYTIIKRNFKTFASGKTPFNYASLNAVLQEKKDDALQTISLQGYNPFIEALSIDWNSGKIHLHLYPDVQKMRAEVGRANAIRDQLLYDDIAFVSRRSGETIIPIQDQFEVLLSQLTNSHSFLAFRLNSIASALCQQLQDTLQTTWHPTHPDLTPTAFPIYDYETFQNLSEQEQSFGLVIYSPSLQKRTPPQGFRVNSIYVIAKGMGRILENFQNTPQSPQKTQFIHDFNHLRDILQRNGFVSYSGESLLNPEYANDFIFEVEDYYLTVLKATREDFSVHGTKRYAVLEFTDVEQRILTENKIDNRIHEDLLKWRDDYYAAQLNIRGVSSYDVPKPTRNVFWDNFLLSCIKYFRGDDRKILHWGLDLSGGKTVQIELRDHNNRIVSNPTDIKQGINELYNRVNKMGVSEVSIRQEGNAITLDFPGSQHLSATDLVKASSMYFHVVNEKFGPFNPTLATATQRFLQEIWNEAVVTNRKSSEELNQIAFKHLYGDSLNPDVVQPRSEAARTLYENGLRFLPPQEALATAAFNETYSKIAVYRGDDFTDWHGQTNPLLIVFNNFALEGSNLEEVHASYDPSKGNFLSFSIQGAHSNRDGQKMNPREDLYTWTSSFAKEKIGGTALESLSGGKGWRMAVVLNGSVISAPTLDSALKDRAMISGSFTQREITQLESDLKAGSLSFTPYILSEKNVSPELGSKEKGNGVFATVLSVILVIAAMWGYYRFGGIVASVAVLFNLLIIWATLQNLQATITLAGIAGIILTLGMAVDANVLVFERIREEFANTGRIALAIQAGYKKAFSAIVDSNVTTIIAAMILLHFDSGPIKAFAITMVIGIISSMFTALFMTRFFFAGWVQNPQHKALNMRDWFKAKNFPFLKYTKIAFLSSVCVIVIGGATLMVQRQTILGMDFTGGYALNIELPPQQENNYRQIVEKALLHQGATSQEFQVRELTPSNQIRLFLGNSLQHSGHPFFGMPLDNGLAEPAYPFQNNPRIVWVVNALQHAGINLSPVSLQNLDKNWTEVSGQMSDTMRNQALLGLLFALFSILIYITIRFEFKYAISATICLVHDLLFTIGVMALLHAIGVPLQIDLNTVAALMTIVGYSLNDTIIVFDRIREDMRVMRKSSFVDIVHHALNVTLSRTMMTSGTTLLVLIPLVLLGGSTLFGFALVMTIGVIFGTLSSLFIAAPLMQFFHQREQEKIGTLQGAKS